MPQRPDRRAQIVSFVPFYVNRNRCTARAPAAVAARTHFVFAPERLFLLSRQAQLLFEGRGRYIGFETQVRTHINQLALEQG